MTLVKHTMVVKGRDVWFAIMPNIVEWFKGVG